MRPALKDEGSAVSAPTPVHPHAFVSADSAGALGELQTLKNLRDIGASAAHIEAVAKAMRHAAYAINAHESTCALHRGELVHQFGPAQFIPRDALSARRYRKNLMLRAEKAKAALAAAICAAVDSALGVAS